MSKVPLEFQYLFGTSIIVVAVVVIAALWRGQRRMIALSSALAVPHALSALLVVPYYWRPPSVMVFAIAFEDVLFMIGVGGMAWIFSVWPVRRHVEIDLEARRITKRYLWLVLGCAIAGFALSSFPGAYRMSAILGSMAAVAGTAVALRRELWPMALAGFLCSGVSYAISMVLGAAVWPEFMALFRPENLWGYRIGGVPLEEIVWASLFGPSWALVMAIVVDARLVRTQKSR